MDRDMEMPTLDEDCLRLIVGKTYSAKTLFTMARASRVLLKLVNEHLDRIAWWHPNLAIPSHRILIEKALRQVGAFMAKQYMVYDGKTIEFHVDTNVEQWHAFLAALPPLKRTFIRCACMKIVG
jgi:hypothetical protein